MFQKLGAITVALTILYSLGCDSPAYIPIPIELRDAYTGMPIANASVDVTHVEIADDKSEGELHSYRDETDSEGKLELQVCGSSRVLDFVNVSFESVIASTTIQVEASGTRPKESIELTYKSTYFTGTGTPRAFSTSVDAPDSIDVIFGCCVAFPTSLVRDRCPHN